MQQAQLIQIDGSIAGIDEAGRGPLAGPVVAAAVILRPGHEPEGLDDSKKLCSCNTTAAGSVHAIHYAGCDPDVAGDHRT